MSFSHEYTLYTRARIYTFFLTVFYAIVGFMLLAILLGTFPEMNEYLFLLAFLASIFVSYCLAQISATGKIKIKLHDDRLEVKWLKKSLFFNDLDRSVGFDVINSYNRSKRFLRIKLIDDTTYNICDKQFLFGSRGDLQLFTEEFSLAYQRYKGGSRGATSTGAATIKPVPPEYSMLNDEVTAQRATGFYVSLIFGSIFLVGLGSLLAGMAFSENSIGMGLGACFVFLLLYYVISRYYYNVPIVRCTTAGISFNKTFYLWDDMEAAQLTGSQPFGMIGAHPMEGAALKFTDGSIHFLHSSMYKNLGMVRLFINGVVPENVVATLAAAEVDATPEEQYTVPAVSIFTPIDGIHYIKGKPYTRFSDVLMWLIIIGLLVVAPYFVADNEDEWAGVTVLFILPAIGTLLLFTRLTNYFVLTPQHFIVKNAYRPWKKKMYLLNDIREVVLAHTHQGDNLIRLVFRNFEIKEHVVTSLRSEDWLLLLQQLRARNIPVKDKNDFAYSTEGKKWQRKIYWGLSLYLLFCIVSYAFIESLDVGETAMIFIKIGWLLFFFVGMIGVIILLSRSGKKHREANEANSSGIRREEQDTSH